MECNAWQIILCPIRAMKSSNYWQKLVNNSKRLRRCGIPYPRLCYTTQTDGLSWHTDIVAYGHVVLVRVGAIKTGSGSWDATTCPYTLPQDYRPSNTWEAALTTENGVSWTGFVRVKSTGVIDVSNCGNAGSADGRHGSLVYPVGA